MTTTTCPRHGGPWGNDSTCPRCTDIDGNPLPEPTDLFSYIEENTLRLEASRRGGGIEVDASEYLGVEGACMTAYQNYLGGGMLGAIGSSANAEARSADPEKRAALAEALKQYFFRITEPEAEDWDEWSADSYEGVQSRPASAY